MFRFWGSQEQQSQDGSSQSHSWYLPSVVSSPTSSRPVTPTASSSSLSQRPSSHVPPSKAVAVIAILKDKSVDELQKFLSDKDAYQQFLHSLDQVNIQTNVSFISLLSQNVTSMLCLLAEFVEFFCSYILY
ncbi:hypothetical protein GLYMA_20G077501v4 [Glycine max]|nr:hypothetical protein GLYMA_20G077501v4 [Glycine max]KAH1035063.1 hypothetical protein GYH30_055160 [Glycine max]